MNPVKNYRLYCLLIGILFSSFQCVECEEELHDRSNFSVTLNTTQNTLEVGDTLILRTLFDSQMELEFSGNTYDNSNQSISYEIELFYAQEGFSDAFPAREYFEFIGQGTQVDTSSRNEWRVKIASHCREERCGLSLGLVAQRAGYFGIALQNGRFGEHDYCKSLTLQATEIETNGSNNAEIFREIDRSGIRIDGRYVNDLATQERMYFFKVVP